MALKLAQEQDKTMPSSVKAMVAQRYNSLAHRIVGEHSNEQKIKEAARMLNRVHKNG